MRPRRPILPCFTGALHCQLDLWQELDKDPNLCGLRATFNDEASSRPTKLPMRLLSHAAGAGSDAETGDLRRRESCRRLLWPQISSEVCMVSESVQAIGMTPNCTQEPYHSALAERTCEATSEIHFQHGYRISDIGLQRGKCFCIPCITILGCHRVSSLPTIKLSLPRVTRLQQDRLP